MLKNKLLQIAKRVPQVKLVNNNVESVMYKINNISIIALYEKESNKTQHKNDYYNYHCYKENHRHAFAKFLHFFNQKEGKWLTYNIPNKHWGTSQIGTILEREFPYTACCKNDSKEIYQIIRQEKQIAEKINRDKKQKEINAFIKFNKQVPSIPKSFYKFINKKVFPDYAIYNNKEHKAVCTYCNTEFTVVKLKRHDSVICPHCKKLLTSLPSGNYKIADRKSACLIQDCDYGIVLRYFMCYHNKSTKFSQYKNIEEVRRDFINIKNNEYKSYIYEVFKNAYLGFIPEQYAHKNQRYYIRKDYDLTNYNMVWEGNLSRLKNKLCKYLFEAKRLNKQSKQFIYSYPSRYILNNLDYPFVESFIKQNRTDIIAAVAECNAKKYVTEISKAINLPKNVFKMLPQIENKYLFKLLQEHRNIPITEGFVKFCNNDNYSFYTLNGLLSVIGKNTDFNKLQQYLADNYINLNDYKDYLLTMAELHVKLNKKTLYPKEFNRAHDEIVTNKKILIENKQEKKYQQIKKTSTFKPLIIDGLLIRLPENLKELRIEGFKQNHCVANYIPTVAKGETTILFARKLGDEETPYITIEVNDNKIIQARYKNNISCSNEERNIIDEYIKKCTKPLKVRKAA